MSLKANWLEEKRKMPGFTPIRERKYEKSRMQAMNPIVTSTVKLSDFIDKQHRYNMLASKRADALNFRYY